MKFCYIDVETGGIDPIDNPLLQIAGLIEIVDDRGTEEATFNFHIKPFDSDKIDPKALAVCNLTMEQIEKFDSPQTVLSKLKGMFKNYVDPYNPQDKFFFVGYNSHSFDMPFVREWFKKNGDKYFGSWFFYPSIDVMLLAADKLKTKRYKMKSFKQSSVAEALGISVDMSSLHDALYDIELTRKIYKEL